MRHPLAAPLPDSNDETEAMGTSAGLLGIAPSSWSQAVPGLATVVQPTPLPQPVWVARCDALAHAMGLEPELLASEAHLQLLAGNRLPAHGIPQATVYSGHQFGNWAGQLGDGRALLLGDWPGPNGLLEVQIKGAGLTPYSRMGDGRAVLRSSIREFLASEAMHGLGIPTTRALALVASPQPVARETWETAAVVTRTAPSFLRFGHFEHFSYSGQHEVLKSLADTLIDRHYPACREANHPANRGQEPNPYRALLHDVALASARLVAQWQSIGFCHGVLNTDNMSMLGLTLDYGPFQFMDGFDPHHICNHTDRGGRYAYNRQPAIVRWNLFALAQALLPLIGEPDDAMSALEPYPEWMAQSLDGRMAAKLGLPPECLNQADTATTVRDLTVHLMRLLASQRVDHTLFWYRLTRWVAAGMPAAEADHPTHPETVSLLDLFTEPQALQPWLTWYLKISEQLSIADQATQADLMQKSNPKYVLRNHLAQQAIERAQQGDFGMVQDLLQVLQHPFSEHPAFDAWSALPPDWAAHIEVSCSS